MVGRGTLAMMVLAAGCTNTSTEQLVALETWSAWSAERAEMTFVAGDQVRLLDRRTDPTSRWAGRLTAAGQDALADVDQSLLDAPIPHDVCTSQADELVLSVRFDVGRDEVVANACPGDPDSPYADVWQLYSELASALVACTDTDWVISSPRCEPIDDF